MPEEQSLGVQTVADFTGCLDQGEFQWWTASSVGIAYKDETPAEAWRANTQNLVLMYQGLALKTAQAAFKVGDSLNWGKEHLGEEWSQVIDATSKELLKSASTLGNWMDIAKSIAPSRRRESETRIEVYKAVAKLESSEQEEFLKLADEENLSVTELRDKIKERHPRKPRASKSEVKTLDNAATILQKLIDCANWYAAGNPPAEKEKGPMQAIYKAYRRQWMGGHKK